MVVFGRREYENAGSAIFEGSLSECLRLCKNNKQLFPPLMMYDDLFICDDNGSTVLSLLRKGYQDRDYELLGVEGNYTVADLMFLFRDFKSKFSSIAIRVDGMDILYSTFERCPDDGWEEWEQVRDLNVQYWSVYKRSNTEEPLIDIHTIMSN